MQSANKSSLPKNPTPNLWQVAVSAPVHKFLFYMENPALGDHIEGLKVKVPLGQRKHLVSGVLLQKVPSDVIIDPTMEIKEVHFIDREHPPVDSLFLQWLQWLSYYYRAPLGDVVSSIFPPLKREGRKKKKVLPLSSELNTGPPDAGLNPLSNPIPNPIPNTGLNPSLNPPLNAQQSQCLQAISPYRDFSVHLLWGVTGSGKTEVYLHLFQKMLREGKEGDKGLFLVPEIALTPQLMNRFKQFFGSEKVCVLHSKLTPRQRTEQWWKILKGEGCILIGTRSALFCPLKSIKMIIVDEEHEWSFKQEKGLKYHGRDAAIMRAKFLNCPIVLGSATPSLESWYNTLQKKYHLYEMPKRVQNIPLPQVEVVDLRKKQSIKPRDLQERVNQLQRIKVKLPFWMSPELYESMKAALDRNEQVALFLNRRGTAPHVLCSQCGEVPQCVHCDIALSLHKNHQLVCHYCSYKKAFSLECEKCGLQEMNSFGLGTEKIEEDVGLLFPQQQILRMDSDEISTRKKMEDAIQRIEKREASIIVGTQMIAKGFNFPHLSLVGMVLADIGFHLPDFRSTERSFQLIVQMAGRAGRNPQLASAQVKVLLQTYSPDHPSVYYACKGDYKSFAEEELQCRAQLNYPPCGRLALVRAEGRFVSKVRAGISLLCRRIRSLQERHPTYQRVSLLGPSMAPIARIKNIYRYQLLLKCGEPMLIQKMWQHLQQSQPESQWAVGVSFVLDVDAFHFL